MRDPHTLVHSPHITEKSTVSMDEGGVYVFRVAKTANKIRDQERDRGHLRRAGQEREHSESAREAKAPRALARIHQGLQEGDRYSQARSQDRHPFDRGEIDAWQFANTSR